MGCERVVLVIAVCFLNVLLVSVDVSRSVRRLNQTLTKGPTVNPLQALST